MTSPVPAANVALRDAAGQQVTTVALPLGTTFPPVIVWSGRAFLKGPTGYVEVAVWVDLTGEFLAAAKADVLSALGEAHRILVALEVAPTKLRDEVRAVRDRIDALLHRSKPTPPPPPAAAAPTPDHTIPGIIPPPTDTMKPPGTT